MLWSIQLLYFVVMIATFIALLLWAKLPTGLALMASAVVGWIFSAIFSGTSLDPRYLTEGMFGYFDTILVITTAMVFMGALQACGALEYISTILVKWFGSVPSLLLIAFMLIIMFPAMVTGSSLASAISAGALVAPIMIKWGIPKAKTGAIIALGSILGMIAPPVNVPAMVICDVVDIPYTGFTLPLLILSIPIALVSVILIGRKYVKPIPKDKIECVVDTSVLKELNWTVCIPLFVLILLIISEMIFPKQMGSFGMPLMFTLSTVVCFFVGRRLPFFKKPSADGKANSVVEVLRQGVEKSLSAMGLLMGVGMFMEIITLNGVRGWIVLLAIGLPSVFQYVGMALSLPIFGGISAFGSASMLGGPFVMALDGVCYSIMVTSGLSMLAAIGEFMPPTAMSATFSAHMVGEKGWTKITKAALPALGVIFVYSLIYVLGFGYFIQHVVQQDLFIWILLAVTVLLAIGFVVLWSYIVSGSENFTRYAHDLGSSDATVQPESTQIVETNDTEAQTGVQPESENIPQPEVQTADERLEKPAEGEEE